MSSSGGCFRPNSRAGGPGTSSPPSAPAGGRPTSPSFRAARRPPSSHPLGTDAGNVELLVNQRLASRLSRRPLVAVAPPQQLPAEQSPPLVLPPPAAGRVPAAPAAGSPRPCMKANGSTLPKKRSGHHPGGGGGGAGACPPVVGSPERRRRRLWIHLPVLPAPLLHPAGGLSSGLVERLGLGEC